MPPVLARGALAFAAVLLVGLLGREVAAPAIAQIRGAPGVPVFQAQAGSPPPVGPPPVAIAATPLTDEVIDLDRLGIAGVAGAAPPPAPATGAIGTSNAYLTMSP